MSPLPKRVNAARRVAESLARRFSTPRGHCQGFDANGNAIGGNDGMDLSDLEQSTMNPRDVGTLRSQIHGECLKDSRVLTAYVTVQLNTAAKSITISIRAYGPFGVATIQITKTPDGTTVSIL